MLAGKARGATLRILQVVPTLDPKDGGPTTAVLGIETALAKFGVETIIASTLERNTDPSAVPLTGPNRVFLHRQWNFYSYAPALSAWLAEYAGAFDLIHIHGLFAHPCITAGRAARAAKIPYIVTPHGMAAKGALKRKAFRKYVSLGLFERRHLRSAAALHLTSQVEYDDVEALGGRTWRVLIPLGLLPCLEGDAMRLLARIGSATASQHIGYVGRIHPIKNIEGLVDAFAILAREAPDRRLLIAGEGDAGYVARLKARVADYGLVDRVHWLGFADAATKADLFAAADCVALPSHFESFGLAALEALQAGAPVALSKFVALAQEARAAGVAEVVDPDKAADIADGLRRLLEASDPQMSHRARAFVTARYSLDAMGVALRRLYEMVLDGANSADLKNDDIVRG